jgi:hypothetical protein
MDVPARQRHWPRRLVDMHGQYRPEYRGKNFAYDRIWDIDNNLQLEANKSLTTGARITCNSFSQGSGSSTLACN